MALRYCVFSEGLKIKWQATSVTLMMELNGEATLVCALTRRLQADQKELCIIQQRSQSVDVGHCGTHATPLVRANVQ